MTLLGRVGRGGITVRVFRGKESLGKQGGGEVAGNARYSACFVNNSLLAMVLLVWGEEVA